MAVWFRISILLLICCLAACSSGSGSEDRVDADDDSNSPDDDDSDDDTVDDDDDDDTATDSLDCGEVITGDILLGHDMDCEMVDGPAIIIGKAGTTLDCNGHMVDSGENAEATIFLDGFGSVTIQNCKIRGGQNGIIAWNAASITISDNEISSVGFNGIWARELHNWKISGNEIYNQGGEKSGIDVFLSENGAISLNTVYDFRLGGIQLLGCTNLHVKENLVYDIGDTCFGFFSDTLTGTPTSDILIKDNEAYNCVNVGANEIMFGSNWLAFEDNYYHQVANGFTIYQGDGLIMNSIVIEGSDIQDCQTALNISGDTDGVVFKNNSISNCSQQAVIENADGIVIYENQFTGGQKGGFKAADALSVVQVDEIEIKNNVFSGISSFLYASQITDADFSENYWNGCPNLLAFNMAAGGIPEVLSLINPVNPLPCMFVDNPMTLVDVDEDGMDDQNCVRGYSVECVTGD